MKNIARSFLIAAAVTASLSAANMFTGTSSSESPYLTPTAPGWTSTSVLTVGDSIGGYMMVGIPDGLGAFDNGDGTMTVLANHELGNTSGIIRGHGAKGAFVSKWVINTSTWAVISGGDLVTSAANQLMWNGTTWAQPGTPYAIARLCSGDLPGLSAFWDGTNGYNGRIFMNGEETGDEGKALAWIVTGSEAGKMYELPHLGKNSWENALARSNYGTSPGAANLAQTAVVLTDDSTPGEVFLYLGTKTNTGNAIQKAGLTNGQLYGIKVNAATGYTGAFVYEAATGLNGTFTLATIFDNASIAGKTGAQLQTVASASATRFARPEDAAWYDHDSLIFNTTGATVNGVVVSSKLYQLDFNSSAAAGILTTGGTIKVLVDSANLTGTDGLAAQKFDNLTVGNDGLIYLQEDPGNVSYIAKHWVVNPNAGTQAQIEASAVQIFESDRGRFLSGGADFRTIDEEHSGIIDITSIVNDGVAGSKWFLVATQNHAAATGANATELVEGGQFVALNYRVGSDSSVDAGTNVMTLNNGARVVASGTTLSYGIALTGTGGVITTTAATTISGQITGSGQLWKNGAGTLTLTGTNNYTGNTNISEGKLVLSGSVASSVLIYKNASIGGSGRINGNLTNLGTLTPGNSPGTLSVTGNYIEGGTLDVEVWGLTAGSLHDQVAVTGSATFQSGSNLKITKTGGTFDLARTESVLAVSASSYSGAFSTLDRSTQSTQVFFNNATGRIHGSGLTTEAQTFADLTVDTNRKAIATALYADGLTSATVSLANSGGSGTAKAFIATGEMGATTVAFLGAANVDTALDALSPEPYGTSMIMASRNALTLARALTGAVATPEGWNVQVGYDQQQATLSASPTTLNGRYDINATYAIATRALSKDTQFSVLISQNDGTTSASAFSSKGSGQSLGVGFATDLGATRLDLALIGGKLKNSGTRNGQSFVDQNLEGSSMLARLSFSKLGAFTPYVGLNRTSAKFDAFSETGTGANLNVSAASQTNTNAEVGLGYEVKVTDTLSMSLNVGYEHNLTSTGNSLTANFADAASPTSFNVTTYGAGQNVFRGGIGFQASLGAGRSAGLSYDMHSGADMKSAHEVKVNYTFRF